MLVKGKSFYLIQIDEPQRVQLINALDLLIKQDGLKEPIPIEEYEASPIILQQMLQTIPELEEEDPGIVHGLCL